MPAEFSASWNAPSFAAPSPKKHTTTCRAAPASPCRAGGYRHAAGHDAFAPGCPTPLRDLLEPPRPPRAGLRASSSAICLGPPECQAVPCTGAGGDDIALLQRAPHPVATPPSEAGACSVQQPRENSSSSASSKRRMVHMVVSASRAPSVVVRSKRVTASGPGGLAGGRWCWGPAPPRRAGWAHRARPARSAWPRRRGRAGPCPRRRRRWGQPRGLAAGSVDHVAGTSRAPRRPRPRRSRWSASGEVPSSTPWRWSAGPRAGQVVVPLHAQ